MPADIIEISSHPNYKHIVSPMVLIVYNSWKPENPNLDDWQKLEYKNALDILRMANENIK